MIDPAPTSPSTSTSTPPAGVALEDLGIENGPDGFRLPSGARPIHIIDQANVVTLLWPAGDSDAVIAHLRELVPALGYEVTGLANGSMTFTGEGWDGAFTSSKEVCGLTLRRK
ncbi:MAG: hypothetical protein CSA63_02035 [Propionibacterium sp.]|nr:MAG: hypothetical protein CSA63_02035 [Propionibacterium sp.]